MNTAGIYDAITAKVMDALDAGVVPWHQPWVGGYPLRMNGKPYRGINVMLLNIAAMAKKYEYPYWLTYKMAKERGGHVKLKEKGTMVIFWKRMEGKVVEEDDEGEEKTTTSRRFMLRVYTVFNLAQTEGVSIPGAKNDELEIRSAADIIKGMPKAPSISHVAGSGAFYSPRTDAIVLPPRRTFKSAEGYYATAFHEMTHSTGHSKRLGRPGFDGTEPFPKFGSPDYSEEELIAEFGASFLCGVAGIEASRIAQSASYIAGWMKALHDDRSLLVSAGAQAQRAADYIRGITFDEKEEAA